MKYYHCKEPLCLGHPERRVSQRRYDVSSQRYLAGLRRDFFDRRCRVFTYPEAKYVYKYRWIVRRLATTIYYATSGWYTEETAKYLYGETLVQPIIETCKAERVS